MAELTAIPQTPIWWGWGLLPPPKNFTPALGHLASDFGPSALAPDPRKLGPSQHDGLDPHGLPPFPPPLNLLHW